MAGQLTRFLPVLALGAIAMMATAADDPIPNPQIDPRGFQEVTQQSLAERTTRRLTEAQFLKAMSEERTLVLDARSEKMFALRHLQEAVNLPFTEFTADSLAQVIPDKNCRVLIYCNNNFKNSPAAFAPKAFTMPLNLSTFPALRAYGYRNVYELGPAVDVQNCSLPFAGSEAQAQHDDTP